MTTQSKVPSTQHEVDTQGRTSKQLERKQFEFTTDSRYKDLLTMNLSESSSDGEAERLIGEFSQIIKAKKQPIGHTLQSIKEKQMEHKINTLQTQQVKEVKSKGLSGSKDSAIRKLIQSSSSSDEEDNKLTRGIMEKAGLRLKQALAKDGVASQEQKIIKSFKPNAPLASVQQKQMKAEELVDTTVPLNLIDLVDQNERKQTTNLTEKALEQANQLLAFDNKYFNLNKRLLNYKDYSQVGKIAFFDQESDLRGTPTCLFVVEQHVFVGNSNGIIRVFDLENQTEQQPLKDNTLLRNKVTSISISQDRMLLVSGYKKGNIALWDLEKAKLMKVSGSIHHTDVVASVIYFQNSTEQSVWVLSSEDAGPVFKTEFTKKSFLGYSVSSTCLFKSRLKCTASLIVREADEDRPFPMIDGKIITVFGSLTELVVCQMSPIKELHNLLRPVICNENSLPYISFGFGLSPIMREKTIALMAVAWDKLIQLYYFDKDTGTLTEDGVYYSDQEITGIKFIADSIILALIGGREIKILYTTKFYPESYQFLTKPPASGTMIEQFEKITAITAHSQLEKGTIIQDIRPQVMHSAPIYNYNTCFGADENFVVFMCSKTFQSGELFEWKSYLEHIKNREAYDWLSVLKVALEIYNGEQKGYSGVPDEKFQREKQMRPYLQELLKESVEQVICQYKQSAENKGKDNQYEASTIAIKVSVEFCINIQAVQFLFSELYDVFYLNSLEEKFLITLEPFILAGYFRKESIPANKIRKLIDMYEKNQNYSGLEKIIQNLDFSDYPNIDELQVICMSKTMVSALLYLMTKQKSEGGEWELGCMQVLNTIFKVFKDSKQTAKLQDLSRLFKLDTIRKQALEKSKLYIGYKLLWTMQLSLEGKTFPFGELDYDNWRAHVYDVSNFITTRDFLQPLLEFDPSSFFSVIILLLRGRPLHYLQSHDEYKKQTMSSFNLCQSTEKILSTFKYQISQLTTFQQSSEQKLLNAYHTFIVRVQAGTDQQEEEKMLRLMATQLKQSLNSQDLAVEPLDKLSIEYPLLIEALISVVKQNLLDQKELIRACERTELKGNDLNQLLDILETQNQSCPKLKVHLLMRRKDYVKIFKIYLSTADLKPEVFTWITNTMNLLDQQIEQETDAKLEQSGAKVKPASEKQHELLKVIEQSLKQLVSVSVAHTITVVSTWFEAALEPFIADLKQHPRVQFEYLTRYLAQNEEQVRQSLNSLSLDREAVKQQTLHKQFLVLQTKLLCEFEPANVHKFVKKDYYPVQECLALVQAHGLLRAQAVLLQRNGSFLEAVGTYMRLLAQELDARALSQALMGYSQEQTRPLLGLSEPALLQFDALVDSAVGLCERFVAELGAEGWFLILSSLQQVLGDAGAVLEQYGSQKETDRFRGFLRARQELVFGKVPLSVSLGELSAQLQLEFKDLKKYYDKRVTLMRDENQYTNLAESMLRREHVEMRTRKQNQILQGQVIHGTIHANCSVCNNEIYTDRLKVSRVFQCGHAFHLACLKEHESEVKCLKCESQQLEFMLSPEEKKKKRQKKKQPEPKSKQDTPAYDSQLVQNLGKKEQKSSEMDLRKLEAFDKVQAQDELYIDSF